MQDFAVIIPILIVQAFVGIALTVLAIRAVRDLRRPQVVPIRIESNGLKPIFRRTNG